ncbi:TrkH family potassium uptake protein [Nibrella saemangeumensis]|uniref:TrkH family potassium uptake protein n=1 Tax=Nibrella saemangeumensis TaxID=1084526 RepID=A0ABP8NQ88_9BACT
MFSQHYKALLRHLGSFLRIPALLCLPTFVVIIVFREWFAVPAFAVLLVLTFGIGQFLFVRFRHHTHLPASSAFGLIALTWLLVTVAGIIPYYGVALTGHSGCREFLDLNSAFFESMSGFTGTGLTMVKKPANLPHCLQWWRSVTEWSGSLGMIFIAVAFLRKKKEIDKIYTAETNSFDIDGDYPKTIGKIWWMYVLFTALSILAFAGAGMPVWEAFNHGLTAISTGGFSVRNDSFTSYPLPVLVTGNIIIVIGAISFKVYYLMLFKWQFRKAWRQTQLRYFGTLLLGLISLLLMFNRPENWIHNTFQAASAIGTCGLNTVPVQGWPLPAVLLLTIAMNLGGNADSTAGGLKTARLAWLLKHLRAQIWQTLAPNEKSSDYPVQFDGRAVDHNEKNEEVLQALNFLLLWLVAGLAGCLVLSLLLPDQFSLSDILFEVSSALNNVGLSIGITDHALRPAAKWTLIVLMWIGRLEIYAVVVLLYGVFGRKPR